QLSITRGAVSGRGHVASKPGEAPNADTHLLANNIETTQTGPLTVQVSSNAPYAADLENGTSKMEPRPYMAPARDKMRPEVERLVQRAVNAVVRGSGR
ncbi:MAG: HK97 gp10 family phage protein, partial [Sphingomonadales bacterium]|nr:HK97 gp10 family phage protein [Sphingomonadales bacterium]